MGPALKEQRRAHAEQHLAPVRLVALASAKRRRPLDPHHRPQSIRQLNSPPMQQLRTGIGTATWKRRAGAGRFPEGHRLTRESGQRGRQHLKVLRQDPDVRAAMRANNAAAQRARAARDPRACSICGNRIEGPRSSRKKTCSEACRRLAQRATARSKAPPNAVVRPRIIVASAHDPIDIAANQHQNHPRTSTLPLENVGSQSPRGGPR
jgi:hypothetical protein